MLSLCFDWFSMFSPLLSIFTRRSQSLQLSCLLLKCLIVSLRIEEASAFGQVPFARRLFVKNSEQPDLIIFAHHCLVQPHKTAQHFRQRWREQLPGTYWLISQSCSKLRQETDLRGIFTLPSLPSLYLPVVICIATSSLRTESLLAWKPQTFALVGGAVT